MGWDFSEIPNPVMNDSHEKRVLFVVFSSSFFSHFEGLNIDKLLWKFGIFRDFLGFQEIPAYFIGILFSEIQASNHNYNSMLFVLDLKYETI